MPTFSDRLKEERERLGLSQQDFAEKCGVTMRSQRNYEKGPRMPDAEYLAAAAKIGANIQYLIVGIEFQKRLNDLSDITQIANRPELTKRQQQVLQEILFALHTDNISWLVKYLYGELSEDEKQLIDNFRLCTTEGKSAIKATMAALISKEVHD